MDFIELDINNESHIESLYDLLKKKKLILVMINYQVTRAYGIYKI